jgi:IS5 family transposase
MGLPLVIQIGPANERDDQRLPALLNAFPELPGSRGRPRHKPRVLQADAGYGFDHTLRELRARRIRPLIKRRGERTHGSGLGKTRYVVEQALSWFNHCRRLRLCYERDGRHFQAFHDLAAALICGRRLWGSA